MNEYETITGEAARLQVSTSTVRRWVKEFEPHAKPRDLITDGRTIRIRHDGLVEWLWKKKKGSRS